MSEADNWRWINDTHEVPLREKQSYEAPKNELTFPTFLRLGTVPHSLQDSVLAGKYRAWLEMGAGCDPAKKGVCGTMLEGPRPSEKP